MVASDVQNRSSVVTSVSASWKVPAIKASENNTFSGVWVGIGGYGDETLIQIGTEQEYYVGGGFNYYTWYELLPDYLVPISNIYVRPGDNITASITLVNDNASAWLIEISDITQNQHFRRAVFYNSSRLSAEWILERPQVNNASSTLADFENLTFTECKATIEGVTKTIGNSSYNQLVMADNQDNPLVSVSPLNGDGSSFNVTYLGTANATAPTTNLHFNKFTELSPACFVSTVFLENSILMFEVKVFRKKRYL